MESLNVNDFTKDGIIYQQCQQRLFSEMMTSSTLIFSTWEEMKEDNRWRLSDVGADYLISLSNWPESCCYCFSSAQLTYLNLISVYKSIWGFVCIFVHWEYSSKCKRLIHKSKVLTLPMRECLMILQPHYNINVLLVCFRALNMSCIHNKKSQCHETKYYNDCFVVKIK